MSDPGGATRFLEIEHKYVVPDDFDVEAFAARVTALGPRVDRHRSIRDVYFLTGVSGHVYRLRRDHELQHLTVKTYGSGTQTRLEVNLELAGGDQLDAVRAFLAPLTIVREARIDKRSRVFEFDDCEVVYYVAECGERRVGCVEIEAVAARSEADGLAVIRRYANRLGLAGMTRSDRSLFALLVIG